jgi:GntR family transcriptional repressor for pyruvate dehydrogenase complex
VEFTPITRTTAAQSIADQILEMIHAGVLKPNDKLPSERELMEKLHVGRSSVREAIQILATLNVISVIPGYGTIVKEPQPGDILRAEVLGRLIGNTMARELLEAREMIEPASVRLACLRSTDEDLARLDSLLADHAQALAEGKPINEYAARFHVLLAEASHNRVVVQFMESILDLLMSRGRKIEKIPDFLQQELDEHRAILEVVRERDSERAAEMMLRHIVRFAVTYDTEPPGEQA